MGDGSAVDGGGSTTGIVGSGVPSGAGVAVGDVDGDAVATGDVGGAAGVAVGVTVGPGDRSDVDVVPPRAGGAPGGAVPRLPEPEGANAGGGVRPAQVQPAHTASGRPSITIAAKTTFGVLSTPFHRVTAEKVTPPGMIRELGGCAPGGWPCPCSPP